jgi:serine/threonine protein kinase
MLIDVNNSVPTTIIVLDINCHTSPTCKDGFLTKFLFCSVVILFLGACITPPHLSMVTEYMEMGSLYYLIHMSGQKKKLSWRRRLKIIRDICRFDFFL